MKKLILALFLLIPFSVNATEVTKVDKQVTVEHRVRENRTFNVPDLLQPRVGIQKYCVDGISYIVYSYYRNENDDYAVINMIPSYKSLNGVITVEVCKNKD